MLSVWHATDGWGVLEKPPGLRTVNGAGPGGDDSIESRLQRAYPRCLGSSGGLITHRLDMETSGLLLVAFNRRAHRSLMRQFEHRKIGKQYVALLDGVVEGASGEIDLPMGKDPLHHVRQRVDSSGKPARTLWRVIGHEAGRTRVEFRPITGRRHQLRVHAATPMAQGGLGAPILGDSLYARPIPEGRLHLHASRIGFWTPGTGDWSVFRSDAPF